MPFAHICQALHLGNLLSPPAPLSGGYTHRMVRLVTTGGDFAVKLLNPEIMARPTAMANFRRAEALEALLEARNLPILPALTIGGQKMQQVGGQYLYVFEYFDGHPLREADITPAHCREMGRVLAQIHSIDRREASPPAPVEPIDWHALADALLAAPEARAEGLLLAAAIPLLEKVTAAAEAAALRLPPEEALCHNDMDVKNVLWHGAEFRIIDLECLDYANPPRSCWIWPSPGRAAPRRRTISAPLWEPTARRAAVCPTTPARCTTAAAITSIGWPTTPAAPASTTPPNEPWGAPKLPRPSRRLPRTASSGGGFSDGWRDLSGR